MDVVRGSIEIAGYGRGTKYIRGAENSTVYVGRWVGPVTRARKQNIELKKRVPKRAETLHQNHH